MPSATIARPSTVSVALNEIDLLAKQYAHARAIIAKRLEVYDDQIRATQRRFVPGIKSATDEAAGLQAQLVAAIEARPELFVKPRTLTLHGIKLGFQKGKGGISTESTEKAVDKIKQHFGDEAEAYLILKEPPRVAALLGLDVKTLKSLGFTVDDTGDSVFVKAADSEVDKLVARILKEGAIEETGAAE